MFRFARHRWLPLLAVATLAACGRGPASVLERAQEPNHDAPAARPVPLDQAGISQYLQVMREAARRVEHPTAAERRMLARADAITAAANRGDTTVDRDEDDVLARALAFRMQMDLQVAKAHGLDPARYQALSERIEDESGELYCDPGSPVPDRLLKPHVAEIEHLVGIVRSARRSGSPAACGHE